jgi:ketosteroid isomerase-like protein
MKRFLFMIQRVAFVVACVAISAMAPAADPPIADEQAKIRAASKAYLTALSQGDVRSIVDAWTLQGTFVDVAGETHLAREMAAREFSGETHVKESRDLRTSATSIRLVTPQVAIEQCDPDADEATTSFLAIWVKQDQRWLLDYLREIPGPPEPPQNPLEELDWLVGAWRTEGEGAKATLETKWSNGKRFLLQEFKIDLPDQSPFRVQQRIGWDPSSKQIRSWLFRSDGGFEEGVWSRAGDVWVVKRVGVMPDGEKTSTVNFWTHEPPEKCWFKALEAKMGDHKLDDVVLLLSRVDVP